MTPESIAQLLEPFLSPSSPGSPALPALPKDLFPQLSLYLDLLLRWNARTNLTAIRDPRQIVLRHFGESLFAARHLPAETHTLLDLGSGAGFPGIPIQLLHPGLAVTLAESQHKKSAFLHEAIRTLHLPTQVFAGRAESLPSSPGFDTVALRAVDQMAHALDLASRLARRSLLLLITSASASLHPLRPASPFHSTLCLPIPSSASRTMEIFERSAGY